MSKIFFFLIAFFQFNNTTGQIKKTDWGEMNLKGKIKEISEHTFKIVEKFGELQKGEPTDSFQYRFNQRGIKTDETIAHLGIANGVPSCNCKRFVTTYDEKGIKTEFISYSGEYLTHKLIYKYDENKNPIEITEKADNNYIYKTIQKFDSKGNLLESNQYDKEGNLYFKFKYKYDIQNNLIESNQYEKDGSLIEKYSYKYDSKGNQIEKYRYEKETISMKYIAKYDLKGNLIESNLKKGDNEFRHLIKYDENGNEIENNNIDNRSKLPWMITYKYDYDKNLNWIKRYQFKNGKQITITERVIIYF